MSFTILQNEKMPFYAIKTTSLKSRKIDIFPKGLTHYFGQKIAIFSTFFQAIQARKRSFTIFKNEKTPFQATKTRPSKSRKIDISPNGSTHGFGPKNGIIRPFFFRQYRPGKCLIRHFPKGVNPWFWSKNGHLSNLFFQAIYARKISFTIFENEKTPFQAITTRSSKSRKINPSFWSKNGHFSKLFFQPLQARKMSFAIFQNKKKLFQAIKTRS